MTPGFECRECDWTEDRQQVSAAMAHTAATGHETVHELDEETTITVNVVGMFHAADLN